MMQIFDARILNTNGARITPFLIFFLATHSATYCLQFVSHCLERLRSHSLPLNLRCSYMTYLSSFLARCKILPIDAIVNTIGSLIEECENGARRADQHMFQKDCFIFDQELMDDTSTSAQYQVCTTMRLIVHGYNRHEHLGFCEVPRCSCNCCC